MEFFSMLHDSLDGRGLGGEQIHVYVWLSPFSVHLKLTTLLIGYACMHTKSLQFSSVAQSCPTLCAPLLFWFCLLWLNDFYPFLSHSSSLIFGIDWAKEISSALIAHVTKLFSQLPENNFSFTLGPTSVFCYIFSSEVADTKCFWVAAHRSCFYLMLLDFCSHCSKWLKTFGPPYLSCRNSPQTLSTKSAALNYCWGSELL